MDVSSATATATATQNVNTQQTSANPKTENKNSASFDEEMKNAQKETETTKEQVNEKNKEKVSEQNNTHKLEQQDEHKTLENIKENLLTKNINEKKELNPADILSINIQNLIDAQNVISNKNEVFEVSIRTDIDLTKNISETINYSNIEMTENDAKFFADIVQNNAGGIQNIITEIQQASVLSDETVQKSATVSKALIDALQNTVKTGQAVRIDFGNDIAVVMRVSKDGSIMANFIPGDKAVENYLKNNIDFLKQRFEEEDIPYSQLSYSHQQNREHRQQNKEDKNE